MSSNLDPRPDENQVLLALLQRLDDPPCLPSHLLEGYVADTLSAQDAEHVHAHLRQCVVCMSALARLQSMHADEPALPVAVTPAPRAAVVRLSASRPAPFILEGLIGNSAAFNAMRAQMDRLFRFSSGGGRLPNVLIEGETGSGKSALALALHRASVRRDGPFIPANSATIPEALAESQLFGHEQGAFSGAHAGRPGFFQQADKGTLFLDEIGLMPLPLQPKLLVAIEDKTVRRVGARRSEPVDVWVISASNENLDDARREKRLREDLYQRLSGMTLRMPPLRERGSDILLLAEHFLERACRAHSLPPKHLDAGAQRALMAYSWPGNVRELSAVIERAVLFAERETLTARDLFELPFGMARAALLPSAAEESLASDVAEAKLLAEVLKSARGSLSRAAALLGVPRNTLRYRLQKLGLLPKKDQPNP